MPDNSTFDRKVKLRIATLAELGQPPVILETHGGFGRLFARCYRQFESGIVFEKDSAKVDYLAEQRPTWAVYQADCGTALLAGIGRHLPINFVDLDPYGSPWETLDSFLSGFHPTVSRLAIVVNDGLRNALKMKIGWKIEVLRNARAHFGLNNLYSQYAEICRWMMEERATAAGYRLAKWTAYYNRHPEIRKQGELPGENCTHWAAIIER